MLIASALIAGLTAAVLQVMYYSDAHYETAQALEQLNQKENIVRDLFTKTIEKAAKNTDSAPFSPTLSAHSPIGDYRMVGEALAVNYHHGVRCDGLALNAADDKRDYFFVSADTTTDKTLSLRCKAPNRSAVSLVAYVEYLALRYHLADAGIKDSLVQHNESMLNDDDWQRISRISVYLIIATDDAYYQNAPAYHFSDDNGDFPNNNIPIDIRIAADGRYRRALYFVIEPKAFIYAGGV